MHIRVRYAFNVLTIIHIGYPYGFGVSPPYAFMISESSL